MRLVLSVWLFAVVIYLLAGCRPMESVAPSPTVFGDDDATTFADRTDAGTRKGPRIIHAPFHPVGPVCHYNNEYIAVDCDGPQGDLKPQ